MRNLLMRRLRTWRIIFTAPSSDGEGYHDVALELILPAEVMLTLSHMAAGPRCMVSPELFALQPRVAN